MAKLVENLDNSVRLYQITDDPGIKDNIYCERSYCAPDSSGFIYQRQISTDGPVWKFGAEFVFCQFGTWEERVIGRGHSYPEITVSGMVYYSRPGKSGDERELVRVNLKTGETDEIPVQGGIRPYTGMTVSRDERYLGYGVPLRFDPQMFGVEVVDLQSGKKEVACQDPFICNPHTEFNPADGRTILVQHNRGCTFEPDGTMVSLLGEEGCTLFTVSIENGAITPLEVGPPHTTSCTGHQQWIGETGEILLSVSGLERDETMGEGNLVAIRPGGSARVVAGGHYYSHVNASRCGRFFCCDDHSSQEIIIGSIGSGGNRMVCGFGPEPESAYECFGQSSHAHPYLSPDNRWVVFNSCRTGRPQIHVAEIPDELWAEFSIQELHDRSVAQ